MMDAIVLSAFLCVHVSYVLHMQAKCFSMERVHLSLFRSSLYSMGISKHEFMSPEHFDFTLEEGGLKGTFPGPNPFRRLPGRTQQPLSPALSSATLCHPINLL